MVTTPVSHIGGFGRYTRSRVPLDHIVKDLAESAVSDIYLKKLVEDSSEPKLASELIYPSITKDLIRSCEHVLRNAQLNKHGSVATMHRLKFDTLATEIILCGIGKVTVVTPTMLAMISSKSDSSSYTLMDMLTESLFVFIDGFVDDKMREWATQNRDGACKAIDILRVLRNNLRITLVYDCSSCNSNDVLRAVSDTYGKYAVDSIFTDVLKV
jgi:hypothetical protein